VAWDGAARDGYVRVGDEEVVAAAHGLGRGGAELGRGGERGRHGGARGEERVGGGGRECLDGMERLGE
jgi:hypothetical protein